MSLIIFGMGLTIGWFIGQWAKFDDLRRELLDAQAKAAELDRLYDRVLRDGQVILRRRS